MSQTRKQVRATIGFLWIGIALVLGSMLLAVFLINLKSVVSFLALLIIPVVLLSYLFFLFRREVIGKQVFYKCLIHAVLTFPFFLLLNELLSNSYSALNQILVYVAFFALIAFVNRLVTKRISLI